MSRRSGKVVMFDMDGVLADFVLGYTQLAAEMYPDRVTDVYGTVDQQVWDFGGTLAEVAPGVWDHIRQSVSFWRELPPLVSRAELQRIYWVALNFPTYFVTARVGATSKRQTEEWLDIHGISRPTVIVSHLKGEAAVVLGATHAIDDKAGNTIATSYLSDCKSYVIDRPYNRFDHDVVGGSVIRVKTVGEYLDAVEAA